MTMTQPMRVKLMHLLEALRPDWQTAGLNAATAALAAQLDDPYTLTSRAIAAASIASNRTPECITWVDGPHVRKTTGTTSIDYIDPCPEHGGRTLRPNGEYGCCYADAIGTDAPLPLAPKSRHTAGFHDQIRQTATGRTRR
jgi:hypothetical protein